MYRKSILYIYYNSCTVYLTIFYNLCRKAVSIKLFTKTINLNFTIEQYRSDSIPTYLINIENIIHNNGYPSPKYTFKALFFIYILHTYLIALIKYVYLINANSVFFLSI